MRVKVILYIADIAGCLPNSSHVVFSFFRSSDTGEAVCRVEAGLLRAASRVEVLFERLEILKITMSP